MPSEALRILRTMDRAAAGRHHILASNTYLVRQAPADLRRLHQRGRMPPALDNATLVGTAPVMGVALRPRSAALDVGEREEIRPGDRRE